MFSKFRIVEASAKNGNGYDELKNQIAEISGVANLSSYSTVLLNERQRACASKAYGAIKEALDALNMGTTMDAVGVCVDDALSALFEMTGKRVTTEVTNEIFSRFCVGK